MSQLCLLLHQSAFYLFKYIYIYVWAQGEFESPLLTVKVLCLNRLTIEPEKIHIFNNKKPSASIALTSSDYKTGALFLC